MSVTQLLKAHRQGDGDALGEAFSAVYQDLRSLARRQLGHGNPLTLNPTGLVHELYLKLLDNERLMVQDRHHFFALSVRAMRQIVVDAARARVAEKRGGQVLQVPLDDVEVADRDGPAWVLEVDEALGRIRDIDERMAQVFECRFFAGLTEEETAEALEVPLRTVQRDWQRGKAWIRESVTRP